MAIGIARSRWEGNKDKVETDGVRLSAAGNFAMVLAEVSASLPSLRSFPP
jgi:hypothetical protein